MKAYADFAEGAAQNPAELDCPGERTLLEGYPVEDSIAA